MQDYIKQLYSCNFLKEISENAIYRMILKNTDKTHEHFKRKKILKYVYTSRQFRNIK